MKSIFDGPVARVGLAIFACIWLAIEVKQGNLIWTIAAGILLALTLADLLLREKEKR